MNWITSGLPRKGEQLAVLGPRGEQAEVRKAKSGRDWTMRAQGSRRIRWGNARQIREDIAEFQQTGVLARAAPGTSWANPFVPGDVVGSGRWPAGGGGVPGRPHRGEVIAEDDPRAWAGTLAFPSGDPDPEAVRAHAAKYPLEPERYPVLWDFPSGQKVYYETEKPGHHGLKPYAEDVALHEAERAERQAELDAMSFGRRNPLYDDTYDESAAGKQMIYRPHPEVTSVVYTTGHTTPSGEILVSDSGGQFYVSASDLEPYSFQAMMRSNPRTSRRYYPGRGEIQGTDLIEGADWRPSPGTPIALTPRAFKALMRKARVTTRDVAMANGIPVAQVSEVRDRGIHGKTSVYNWMEMIARASYAKHLQEGVNVMPAEFTGGAAGVFMGRAAVLGKGRRKAVEQVKEAYGRLLAMIAQTDPSAPYYQKLLRGKEDLERSLRAYRVDPDKLLERWELQKYIPGSRGHPWPEPNPARLNGQVRNPLLKGREYMADILEREGLRDLSVGWTNEAPGVRALLKKHKVKASVTVPRHSMAFGIDVSPPGSRDFTTGARKKLATIFGVEFERGTTNLDTHRREAETHSYRGAGPQLRAADAKVFVAAIRKKLPEASAPAPALGFNIGDVVKYVGKRQRKRYVVGYSQQYSQGGARNYSLSALTKRGMTGGPSGVSESDIELDKDQVTGVPEHILAIRGAAPVAWDQVSITVGPNGLTLVRPHSQRQKEVRVALVSLVHEVMGTGGTRAMKMVGAGFGDPSVIALPSGLDPAWVAGALMDVGLKPVSPPPEVDVDALYMRNRYHA